VFKNYEVLEHTADFRLKIKAFTLKGLFKQACLAITGVTAEKHRMLYPEKHKIVITQKADNPEELFINWLNELLSVSAAEGLIFEEVKISRFDPKFIAALAIGSDMRNYKVNVEIKAATYHELKVAKAGLFWQAEVILDV
jgi:SHS2 domain-containing protein